MWRNRTPRCMSDENVKWYNQFGKQYANCFNLKTKFILQPGNLTPRYPFKKNENVCPHQDSHGNVHSSLVHNGQNVETTQTSTNL